MTSNTTPGGIKRSAAAKPAPFEKLANVWFSERTTCDRLVKEWQDLEHQLSLKARSLGIELDDAMRRPWPEVRAMCDLMRRIKALDRQLALAARRILRSDSLSADGAMAKILLALRMRQPGADDDAWAFVQSGYDELVAHRRRTKRPG